MSMCLIRLRRGRIFRQRGICAPRESSSRCRVSKLILSPSKLATVWGDWTASGWCVPSVLLRLTDENLRQGGTAFTTSAAQGRLFICAVSFDRTESKWWHNFNLSVNSACHFYFLDRSAKWVTNVVETTDTRGIWRLRRQHLNRGHLIKFLLIRRGGGGEEGPVFRWVVAGEKAHLAYLGSFEERAEHH